MKVSLIDVTDIPQSLPVGKMDAALGAGDEPVGFKRPYRLIDVNGVELAAERLRKQIVEARS